MILSTTNPDRLLNLSDRSVTFTWALGESTTNEGEPCTATTELFVSHDKDSKAYTASARRIDVIDHRGYKGARFSIGGGTSVYLSRVPAARYSAKGLEAAADFALSQLRDIDPDMLAALSDPNSPA